MNLIIYKNNEIKYFVKDCIKQKNNFLGSNIKLYGIKSIHFDFKWTRDKLNPILENEEIIGWNKNADEVTEEKENREIKEVTEEDYREAVKIRNELAKLSYNQVDNFVENNVTDLKSAKEYLKKLSKIVLAIIKMQDK